MKYQMDVGDIRGELEIHYGNIPIRSHTTTSAQMHWSSHSHILEYRVFRSSGEDSVLKKPSREQRVLQIQRPRVTTEGGLKLKPSN